MKTGHEKNQESLNQIFNTRENVKSGYAPYYNDSTISEKGKKAYEWPCDFVGQNLELGHHPWYGPTVYLDVNKMNITPEMLEEINNRMWEMDGNNSIAAQSGDWGYGNVYEVTFDQNHNVQSSRRPIKSSCYTDGYDAYYKGRNKENNPWKRGTLEQFEDWTRGWEAAEKDYMDTLFRKKVTN